MPMATPPVKKKTVPLPAEVYLVTTAVLCDTVELLLLFFDGVIVLIPVVAIVSIVIAVLDLISDGLTFLMCGLFKGKNATPTLLTTFAMMGASAAPIIENMPSRTPGVLYILAQARHNDHLTYEEAKKKYQAELKDEEEQWAIQQRANQAAQNAYAQRTGATTRK
jgi:hypothetical protein